jgi:hypothetical protein
MVLCDFEKYFGEYIDGKLNRETEINFVRHIEDCATCRSRLDEYYEMHRLVKNVKRPEPDNALVERYKSKLSSVFGKTHPVKLWYYSVDDFLNRILPSPSLWWRVAAAVIVLIFGIFIGRFLLKPADSEQMMISETPYIWEKPISNADIEYINYYLLASEMILLEIENLDPEDSDLLISNDTAQKLLIKTFLVHESALQLNEPQLLRFLSKMELILYELANAEEGQDEELLESIRMVINNSDLLEEVRSLQKVIADTKKG